MVYRKLPTRFGVECVKKSASRYIINELPKTFNDAVYPQLPFMIRSKAYKIKTKFPDPHGSQAAQLNALTFNVSSLIRDERIVVGYNKATEMRLHVERLIVEAMRNGDTHRPTMALANYWLREKNLIHKLFKVLVPRYINYPSTFTAIHMLGRNYAVTAATITELKENNSRSFHQKGEAVIELRGNNLPPIIRPQTNRPGLLSNVLIDSARQSYRHDAALAAATKSNKETQPDIASTL